MPQPASLMIPSLAVVLAVLGTCDVPSDDAGDTAFVHQAVQTLLGRKPHGTAEVQALTNLVATHSREAVVDALMKEPEFVTYWTMAMADAMNVQRDDEFAQAIDCFREGSYLAQPGADAAKLADHLRDQNPFVQFDDGNAATVDAFNGHDAISAAVEVDDLMVAWRPWLFTVAAKPAGAEIYERRDTFLKTAFNVQADCITCHSSTYSVTEVYFDNQGNRYGTNKWDRSGSPGWDLERTTFSSGADSLSDDGTEGAALYATDCANLTCHGGDGKAPPWVAAIGAYSPKILTYRAPFLSVGDIKTQILEGGGAMGPRSDLDNDGDTSDDGAQALLIAEYLHEQLGSMEGFSAFLSATQFSTTLTDTTPGPWGLSRTQCGYGWIGGGVELPDPTPFAKGISFAPSVVDVVDTVTSGVAAIPAAWGSGRFLSAVGPDLPSPADPAVAPAMMLVRKIADDILAEVSGSRLTVAHGMPRSTTQALLLAAMTQKLVVDDGVRVRISLKSALKAVVLSSGYNRRSPKQMAPSPNDPARGAYQLPPAANPWVETVDADGQPYAPDSLGNNANGQGDLVHRRSPDQLLWSLHHELNWPAPRVYPRNVDPYPSAGFMDQIGRYVADNEPGKTKWSLESLLYWEATVGACANPTPTKKDWIDALVTQPLNGRPPPLLKDLVLALKDRLLQEPVLTLGPAMESEEALLNTFFASALPGVAAPPLDQSTSAMAPADLEAALRKYCGAILMSPDYLLAGVSTARMGWAPFVVQYPVPAYAVCVGQESCTVLDWTSHYECSISGTGC